MTSHRTSIVVFILAAIWFYTATCILEIDSPVNIKGTYRVVGHKIGSINQNWTKRNITLVRDDFPDVTGKAVIINSEIKDFEDKAFDLQEKGAVLILHSIKRDSVNLGIVSYLLRHPHKSERMNIPFVTTYAKDLFVLNYSEVAYGTIYPDPNSYYNLLNHWAYYLIIFLLISYTLFCFIVAVCILYHHFQIRSKNSKIVTIPIVCLVFEAIANLLRVILLLDPFQGLRLYSWLASQFLTSASLPFSLGSALLVAMYWHESIRNKAIKVEPFLHKTKITFICITASLFLFYILSGISRGLQNVDGVVTNALSNLFWVVILISVTIISVYGFIVCRALISYSRGTSIKTRRLNMMRLRLNTFCALQILLLITMIGLAFVISFGADAILFASVMLVYIVLLDTLSLVQSIPLWVANRRKITGRNTSGGIITSPSTDLGVLATNSTIETPKDRVINSKEKS